MKRWFASLLGALALLALALPTQAQQAPVLTVSLLSPANEGSVAAGGTVTLSALAVGTQPAAGFTYTF